VAVEDAIYSRGTTHAGLSALIGLRLYPGLAPQNVGYPAVVYQRISAVPESLMTDDTDILRERFQMTVLAEDYATASATAIQVKAAFQRWQGTEASVIVEDSFLSGDIDLYNPDTELHQRAIDFEIVHRG